jgi:hypothetical protein
MKKIKEYQYMTGVLIQSKKEDIPVKVDRYLFSAMANNYFEAAFAEEPELENIWKNPEIPQAQKSLLIRDVAEYYFLDMFLDWFSHGKCNCPGFMKTDMKEFEVSLNGNTFWRIFTRPMEERAVFNGEQRKEGVTQYSVSDDNGNLKALCHDFQPFLPVEVSFYRYNKGLIINGDGFEILLRVLYEGCRFPLPEGFARYYLGFRKNSGIRINMELSFYKQKRSWNESHQSFFKKLAGFLEFFKESFSFDHFLKKYDWENLLIQSEIFDRLLSEKLAVKS